jgi:NAD(P)-dependent dehydrogenase (short-subunit alcohol dehydrogenase family)
MTAAQTRATRRIDSPLVWLISGCSTGIGREIALAALGAGDRVLVTARRCEAVADIVEACPEQARSAALDVTDTDQIDRAVQEAVEAFGRIDVLVNNAGYGYVSAVEEGVDTDVRRMFDTNFFGAVDLIKAVLPGMRARRDGYIVNISSMTGLVSNPANVYYSASKFAMESLTEGLAKEVAPLGIRVSAVEPGLFRTDWSSRSMQESEPSISDYQETIGKRRALIRHSSGGEPGDPRKVGQACVMLSRLEAPPLRLLLGADVLGAARAKLEGFLADLDAWEEVTLDVGFPEDAREG